jgi:hypothetical protein
MNDTISLAGLLFSILFVPATSATTGTGTYFYGPETSDNYACSRAEISARIDAIRSVIGENLYVDEFNHCSEDKSKNIKCSADKTIYSVTDSYVKSVKSISSEIKPMMGKKACTVDVDVRVTSERPKIDAFVDGKFMYRSGDEMKFRMATNKPTKVYMFHIEGSKATMMWPSYVGTNNKVENELHLPTPGYKFIARASKDRFDEQIVFVFTNEEINFMRDYDVNDFNNKLMSIKISDRRIIRRNLVIEQ